MTARTTEPLLARPAGRLRSRSLLQLLCLALARAPKQKIAVIDQCRLCLGSRIGAWQIKASFPIGPNRCRGPKRGRLGAAPIEIRLTSPTAWTSDKNFRTTAEPAG